MVKIEGVQTYQATKIRKKNKPSSAKGGSEFMVSSGAPDASSVVAQTDVESASEIASIGQLMALQEVDDINSEGRRSLEKGENALKTLELLQNEILCGRVSRLSLDRIIAVVKTMSKDTLDPHLSDVVAQIKQRAMVEVAKIEMSQKRAEKTAY